MAKPTPGPWQASLAAIYDEDWNIIADCGTDSQRVQDECEANAEAIVLARQALEQVEWVEGEGRQRFCPWCDGPWRLSNNSILHAPNCIRQKALGL